MRRFGIAMPSCFAVRMVVLFVCMDTTNQTRRRLIHYKEHTRSSYCYTGTALLAVKAIFIIDIVCRNSGTSCFDGTGRFIHSLNLKILPGWSGSEVGLPNSTASPTYRLIFGAARTAKPFVGSFLNFECCYAVLLPEFQYN